VWIIVVLRLPLQKFLDPPDVVSFEQLFRDEAQRMTRGRSDNAVSPGQPVQQLGAGAAKTALVTAPAAFLTPKTARSSSKT